MVNEMLTPMKINQQTIFATSAGTKSSYAYERLIDVFENQLLTQIITSVSG